jgi:hypothetical protein
MPAVLAPLAHQPVKEGEAESVSNEIKNESALTEMAVAALGSETYPGTPARFA